MLNQIWIEMVCKDAAGQLSDYDVLKSQLLSEIKHTSVEEFALFKNVPIVVTKKVPRDAINDAKAHIFPVKTLKKK